MIKKWKLPPPLFNDYVSGGYMMWAMYPEYKVFIDSRGKPYDITHVWDDYKELMENPTKENIRKMTFPVSLSRGFDQPGLYGNHSRDSRQCGR